MADLAALKRIVARYRDRLHRLFDRATVSSLVLQRGDNLRTLGADARDLMNAMTDALGAPRQSRRFGTYVTPHVRTALQSLGRIERKAARAGLTPGQINTIVRAVLRRDGDPRAKPLMERANVTTRDVKGLVMFRLNLVTVLVDQGFRAIRLAEVNDLRRQRFVTAEWMLSPFHTVKDECDQLAGRRFRLDQWPDPPHPNCGCMPGNPA